MRRSGSLSSELLTASDIADAEDVLAPVVRRPPVVASRILSNLTGHEVRLECENLQRTGPFKPRGAYNRISRFTASERTNGVVAASAGNHAQGVAWAATELNIAPTVFMPTGASLPKLVATKAYGATVNLVGDTVDEALTYAREFAERTGAVLIHPSDHADIVAGQATLGTELLTMWSPSARTHSRARCCSASNAPHSSSSQQVRRRWPH